MTKNVVCRSSSVSGRRSNSGADCPAGGASSVSTEDQSLEEQPSAVHASTLTSYLQTHRHTDGVNHTHIDRDR